jgi:hypothetical protein
MHDPMTVAWEIKSPFKQKHDLFQNGYRNTWVTVWHVDPERDGSDDSCDWVGWKRKLSPEEKAIVAASWNLERVLDNPPFYPDHEAHLLFQPLKKAIRQLNKRKGFRIHPRYHFWHYQIQIVPLQQFKRWAFSRCCKCGGRFAYGESVCGPWSGTGPRWFRNERGVYHTGCDDSMKGTP